MSRGESLPGLTLLAGMLTTGVLGSIHAFSVLLVPLETEHGISRATASAVYSTALVTLTIAVLFGYRFYRRLSPPVLIVSACIAAALGMLAAARAEGFAAVLGGYGIVFGAANGIGYGFTLQLVAQAMPARKGLAMGTVTAVYALGAMGFAKWLDVRIAAGGAAAGFELLAVCLALTGVVAGAALHISGARYDGDEAPARGTADGHALTIRLWLVYGLGVAAGLMAIGHATGIYLAAGATADRVVLGAMLIGLGNAGGGALAGWLADRVPARRLLAALPLLSAAGLAVLVFSPAPAVALAALSVVGCAYGAIISVCPAAVATYFGPRAAARAYGKVFTAWGLAGLGAPWLAGALHDRLGDYTVAMTLAAGAGILAAGLALLLPEAAGGDAAPMP